MDVWAVVATERRSLADAVSGLDESELDAPSWCDGWRVRDVLGHLVYLAEATQWRVAADIIRRGPSPDRALARLARELGDKPVAELADRLRAGATGRFHLLGTPPTVALGEQHTVIDMNLRYSQWLRAAAEDANQPWVASRPLDTLAARILDVTLGRQSRVVRSFSPDRWGR